jgi:hypothetical protein
VVVVGGHNNWKYLCLLFEEFKRRRKDFWEIIDVIAEI